MRINQSSNWNQATAVARWISAEMKPDHHQQVRSGQKHVRLPAWAHPAGSFSLPASKLHCSLHPPSLDFGQTNIEQMSEAVPVLSLLWVILHEKQKVADKRPVSCPGGVWERTQVAERNHEEVMGEGVLLSFWKTSMNSSLSLQSPVSMSKGCVFQEVCH